MKEFDYHFDKIFILKSLGESDTYADDLYYSIIQPCCQAYGLATEPPIEIYDKKDWDDAIERILGDDHRFPLIHFEMHGDKNAGLSLRLGDCIPWSDVINDLTRINVRSEFNLIITMAVCFSTELVFNLSSMTRPAPFLFSVTTRLKVRGDVTYSLFSVFFTTLIETRSLYDALKQVELKLPEYPPSFDLLAVPFLFENTLKEFALKYQDKNVIETEFYHSFPEMQEKEVSKEEFEVLKRAFVERYFSAIDTYYRNARDVFFMFDRYPHNRLRFNLSDSIMELDN